MKYTGYFSCLLAYCCCWQYSVAQSSPVTDTVEIKMVVVTAQFAPTESRETVNSIKIIDRKTIETRAATNLQELLQTEANLRISQDPSLGSSVSINGLRSENLKILVDGVPVVGRLDGSIDVGQLPLSAVAQVEIIEGAQSLIYGSEAAAGVINLITKQSQLKQLEAEITGLLESNGYQSLQARAGAKLGKFLLQVNAGILEFEPKEDTTSRDQIWNPKEQKNARAMLRFNPNENLNLRASGSYFVEDVTNLGELRRPQFKPYAFDDYYQTERTDANLSGDGWLKNRALYWQASAAWNRFDRRKNSYRREFDPVAEELIEGQQDTSAAIGYLVRAMVSTNIDAHRLNFLLGAEHYTEQAEGVRFVDSTEAKTGFASNTDLGIFASLKYRLAQKMTLQGGARFTHNARFGHALTPSIWWAWRPTSAWEFKASYANGFRSPGLKELYFNFIDINHFIVGNTELQPEHTHNLRVETKYLAKLNEHWQLDLTASGFYNKVKDRIILTEFAPTQYNYQNLADWQTTGAGLTLGVSSGSLLRIKTALIYTGYFNALSADEADVPDLSWSPDWVNEVNLNFWEQRAGVSVWHKMTGETPYFFTDGTETKEGSTEVWHLLNASVNGNFWSKKIRLVMGVKNLLDVQQIRAGATGATHSGGDGMRPAHWGRSFFLQATVGFTSKK